MATTGTQVFNLTMDLIDASVAGIADNSDTQDYKNRMVSVINVMASELYQYSDTRTATSGQKSVPTFITALSENVGIDDSLARGVLPYGAAALLLAGEDAPLANYHQQLYQEKLARLKNIPAVTEDIENLYGDIVNPSSYQVM